jgi:Glycogen synthase
MISIWTTLYTFVYSNDRICPDTQIVQMFTAGRYEYRNKGVDMFIESLAR